MICKENIHQDFYKSSQMIEQIKFQPYTLCLRSPFKTAQGCIGDRQGFVIKICSKRLMGMGESAPLHGFGMETLAETEIALQQMSEAVIGQAISNIDEVMALLSPFDKTPAAKHGVELALLDLLAKSQGLPLANYLCKSAKSAVTVNAVIGSVAPAIALEQAKLYLRQGYKCIKVKVGANHIEADFQVLAAVRTAVGDRMQIRIDANQSWSVDQAIANLNRLEPLDIEYAEQPVTALDLGGMAKVKAAVGIKIAADESVTNLKQLQQVINQQSADLIIIKPMAMGGILAARQAADIAQKAGLEVVVTTTIDGAIARLGALHLAASLPQLQKACGLATGNLLAEDLPYTTPQPKQGAIAIPLKPGLGYSDRSNSRSL
jgi:o-succinylbenzoate synthase